MISMLLLTRYDRAGASSRVRTFQYIPFLEAEGIRCQAEPLLGNEYLEALYSRKPVSLPYFVSRYMHRLRMLLSAHRFDVVLIEKELFPNFPAWLERLLAWSGTPYMVDYDDAIFHGYELARNPVKRLLKDKIGTVMRDAALVTAGNSYLADHARNAQARNIAILPTAIDLRSYPAESDASGRDRLVVGWIGTPFTARYLEPIFPVIEKLGRKLDVELAVVGAPVDVNAHPRARSVPWSEATEGREISRFDIGIMPLPDSPWERGKCGYKLIQCMACGKPVVASPVGVNVDIVRDGLNGFLAKTQDEWMDALSVLLEDPGLRSAMGRRGRAMVEEKYCIQVTAPRLAQLVKEVVASKGRAMAEA